MEFDARKEIKLIIEKWLKDTLKKSDIKENDNLIEKGLSSMQVMQLSEFLKKKDLEYPSQSSLRSLHLIHGLT